MVNLLQDKKCMIKGCRRESCSTHGDQEVQRIQETGKKTYPPRDANSDITLPARPYFLMAQLALSSSID